MITVVVPAGSKPALLQYQILVALIIPLACAMFSTGWYTFVVRPLCTVYIVSFIANKFSKQIRGLKKRLTNFHFLPTTRVCSNFRT